MERYFFGKYGIVNLIYIMLLNIYGIYRVLGYIDANKTILFQRNRILLFGPVTETLLKMFLIFFIFIERQEGRFGNLYVKSQNGDLL